MSSVLLILLVVIHYFRRAALFSRHTLLTPSRRETQRGKVGLEQQLSTVRETPATSDGYERRRPLVEKMIEDNSPDVNRSALLEAFVGTLR